MDETQADDSVHADTRERRVIEPDLLWIKGVTERLLGTAGRPAAWERAYFEDATDETPAAPAAPAPPAAPAAASSVGAGDDLAFRPADPRQQLGSATPADLSVPSVPMSAPEPVPAAEQLPQREIRDFDGPIRYRQPKAPAVAAPALPVGRPVSASRPGPYGAFDPLTSPEPPPYDGPLAPQAPVEPRHTDDMPPAVLRAALRDALPDDLGLRGSGSAGSPADAVFGDPRWNLPPDDDEPASVLDLDVDDLAPTAPVVPAPVAPAPSAATHQPAVTHQPAETHQAGVTSYLPTPEELTQPLAPASGTSPEGSLYAAALAEDLAQEQVPAAPAASGKPGPSPEPAAPAPPAASRGPVASVPGPPQPEIPDAPESADPTPPSVIAPDALLAADTASAAPSVTPAEQSPLTDVPEIAAAPDVTQAPASSPSSAPVEAAASAPAGSGFPRPIEELEASDVALRRAFLSGDVDLAEAVVRLIGEQGRDKQRIRTVLAYLDALLDGGGQALPGAARLRAILGDA